MLRRLARIVVALAALSALGGALLLPIASVAWPRYQVWAELPIAGVGDPRREGEELIARRPAGPDPWGRPWANYQVVDLGGSFRIAVSASARSVGPDGVDDRGGGDDVAVDGDMELVRVAPQLGVLAAVVLLWLVAAVRSLRRGRGPEAWHDMVRAAVAAPRPEWRWPSRPGDCRSR